MLIGNFVLCSDSDVMSYNDLLKIKPKIYGQIFAVKFLAGFFAMQLP